MRLAICDSGSLSLGPSAAFVRYCARTPIDSERRRQILVAKLPRMLRNCAWQMAFHQGTLVPENQG